MSKDRERERPRIVVPRIFCRSCASPLVQATDWSPEGDSRWSVLLWCPECGFERSAVVDQAQVTYLSLAIEEGFACLLEALAELDVAYATDAALGLAERARSERIEPAGE